MGGFCRTKVRPRQHKSLRQSCQTTELESFGPVFWGGRGAITNWATGVSRKRVLRLMREHALLSPHRARTRPRRRTRGTSSPTAPNIMWATDASVPQQAA